MSWDRIKESFFRAARGASPRVEYYRPFFGTVVAQKGNTVDVVPDDPMMPATGLQGIPLRHGLPGISVSVTVDPMKKTSVVVAYENGDPARAYASLWAGSEAGVTAVWAADLLTLGGTVGAEPPVKGVTFNTALAAFLTAFAACVTASNPAQVQAAVNAIGAAAATLALALPTWNSTKVIVQ